MLSLTAWLALLWIIGTLVVVVLSVLIARRYGHATLIGLFTALYVASSVLANKLIVIFGFVVPAGTILFSITFLLTDMLSEFFGKSYARRAVWLGLLGQIILITTIWVAIAWPSPDYWNAQEAFETTLGSTWRIVLGSIVAYIVSQNHDVWAYHFWKEKFEGKHLWLRNNLSTVVSQLLDSTIFSFIAFYGSSPVLPLIIGTFTVKFAIAISDTPFMYLSRIIYNNNNTTPAQQSYGG